MSELALTGDGFLDSYTGERPLRGRHVVARRSGRCTICGGTIRAGSSYIWSEQHRRGACVGCGTLPDRRVRP
ncbi:MAG TPA: hypothetical protein PLU22_06950 [Polyangiaceae bacterium]|nr:hypothetical protein [Polyangiaceae bacterium]